MNTLLHPMGTVGTAGRSKHKYVKGLKCLPGGVFVFVVVVAFPSVLHRSTP